MNTSATDLHNYCEQPNNILDAIAYIVPGGLFYLQIILLILVLVVFYIATRKFLEIDTFTRQGIRFTALQSILIPAAVGIVLTAIAGYTVVGFPSIHCNKAPPAHSILELQEN